MITIYDVAKRSRVAPSTVSKVINNYPTVSDATKEKVRRAMRELDFIPNSMAKCLGRGYSYNIGVLMYMGEDLPCFRQHLFVDILESFKREVEAYNFDLLFISKNVAGKNESYARHCISRCIDGVLLFGDMSSSDIKELIDSDIPTVGFDYVGDKMSGVCSDNCDKMYALTKYLINMGHRDILFIYGEHSEITDERIKGFRTAMAENGIVLNGQNTIQGKYCDSRAMQMMTKELLLRRTHPTAIMYPDDYAALGGLAAAHELGIRVPEDLSVTGFDGIDICQAIRPKLTTVRQDVDKIGKQLAVKLLGLINGNNGKTEQLRVLAEVLTGETVAAPSPKSIARQTK